MIRPYLRTRCSWCHRSHVHCECTPAPQECDVMWWKTRWWPPIIPSTLGWRGGVPPRSCSWSSCFGKLWLFPIFNLWWSSDDYFQYSICDDLVISCNVSVELCFWKFIKRILLLHPSPMYLCCEFLLDPLSTNVTNLLLTIKIQNFFQKMNFFLSLSDPSPIIGNPCHSLTPV